MRKVRAADHLPQTGPWVCCELSQAISDEMTCKSLWSRNKEISTEETSHSNSLELPGNHHYLTITISPNYSALHPLYQLPHKIFYFLLWISCYRGTSTSLNQVLGPQMASSLTEDNAGVDTGQKLPKMYAVLRLPVTKSESRVNGKRTAIA